MRQVSDDPLRNSGHASRQHAIVSLVGATLITGLAFWLLRISDPGPFATAPRLARQVAAEPANVERPRAHGATLDVQVRDDLGNPIPGADVRAWIESDELINKDNAAAENWTASTAASGNAGLEPLPSGIPIVISASAVGHENTLVAAVELPRAAPVRVTLQRTAALSGELTLRQDGSPHPGTVVIAGSGVWPPRQLAVGPSGRFLLEGLPGGVYEIHASAPGLVAEPIEGITIEPSETLETQLQLGPASAMRGRVINIDTRLPIAGAEVVVGEDTLAFNAAAVLTDAAGNFQVDGLRDRPHRLSITAAGYVGVSGIEQRPGLAPTVHGLVAAAELRGTVVDTEGRPVAGVALEIIGNTRAGVPLALTQGSLAFRSLLFEAQRAGPRALVSSDSLGVTVGAVPPIPLVPGPLGSASIARSLGRDNAVNEPTGFISDTNGRFALTDVPPGRLQLVASPTGWAVSQSAPLEVQPGKRVEGIVLVLRRGASISGSVIDDRDFPVPHVRVDLECRDDPTPRSTVSDASGQFVLAGAIGDCEVIATPARGVGARQAVLAENNAALTVELRVTTEAITLECEIVDARGFPIAGAAVSAQSETAGGPVAMSGLSSRAGHVEIGGLPEPPWRVDVTHPDFAPLLGHSVAARSGTRLVLRAGTTVQGTLVSDWDGGPLAAARVTLRSINPEQAPQTTRAGTPGGFEFRNVTIGDYELFVQHPQTASKRISVQVTERDVGAGSLDLGSIALTQAGAISGTVVDRLGVPVGAARVTAGPAVATTDNEGRFLLAGLAPGLVSVEASHATAGAGRRAIQVRVFATQENGGLRLQLAGRYEPTEPTGAEPVGAGSDPPAESTPKTAARNGVAVEVATGRGGVNITVVAAGSLAERAGLRPGDVIVGIDGEPTVIAGQARSLLRGEPGSQVTIELKRGTKRQRINVRRERFDWP